MLGEKNYLPKSFVLISLLEVCQEGGGGSRRRDLGGN